MRPVVLDVTRTLSPKSIATPTGIDRVERAYIEYFLKDIRDVRFVYKDVIIGRGGMTALFERVLGNIDWGARDFRAIVRGDKGRLEADIRRYSGAKLPESFTYLNVGHSNCEYASKIGASRVIALVHDIIPLTHPQFQTKESVVRFRKRLRSLAEAVDIVICGTQFVSDQTSKVFESWGQSATFEVIRLGVQRPAAVTPKSFRRPSFVVLGTIEPRKNHKLLLDVWAEFTNLPEPDRPQLHIIGRRGWLNEDLFKRLDHSPLMGRDIIEHGLLSDLEVAAMLQGVNALLFPSFVEGYGLPLMEALSVGVPTLVSDIPAFQELGGPLSLYLNPFDANVWKKEIMKQSKQGKTGTDRAVSARFDVPNWHDHFARLENFL